MKTRGRKSKASEEPSSTPTMCFVERFVAPAPEYRPLVVISLSGLTLFGMRMGTRFQVHVPLEDTYRDYCDMLQLSHWMEVVPPVFVESAEAPPPKAPDRSEDVYL